jgi:hypothetical protein
MPARIPTATVCHRDMSRPRARVGPIEAVRVGPRQTVRTIWGIIQRVACEWIGTAGVP